MKKLTVLFEVILLVAVLSIPAWLFQNWWKKIKKVSPVQAKPVATAKANAPELPAPAASTAAAVPLPAVAAQPAANAAMPVSAAAAAPSLKVPPAVSSNAGVSVSASTPAAPVIIAPVPAAAALSSPVVSGVAASAADPNISAPDASQVRVSYSPKNSRNPFISQDEYVQLEAAKRKIEEAVKAGKNKKAPGKDKFDRSAEKQIELQGIIGRQAIVNGKAVRVGSLVHGAKLIKVSEDYVIFSYKGRNFTKRLPQ